MLVVWQAVLSDNRATRQYELEIQTAFFRHDELVYSHPIFFSFKLGYQIQVYYEVCNRALKSDSSIRGFCHSMTSGSRQ